MKYAFINGIILNGKEDMEPETGRIILTDEDRITGIVESFQPESGYKVIDLQGKYILPGLINMHVHLAGNGKPQKKQRDNARLVRLLFSNPITVAVAKKVVERYARLELLSGVTTIRTVGGLRNLDTELRDKINYGKIAGPRIIAANEGISVPGGHMAGSVAIAAENIEEALKLLEKVKHQNVDIIKLMITGGVLDAKEKGVPGELKMPLEMVKAVCDRAHEYGYKVAAHVESTEGVLVALKGGVDSIEHGAEPTPEIIKLFKDNQAYVTTTISPALPYALFDRSVSNASEVEQYNGNVVFEGIIECAKAALEEGIPVALGNDVGCPWITQYDFWRELYWFEKYVGVSKKFALYSATLNNAKLAGIDDITGSIEVGKMADMIVVRDNPLEDLTALRNVDMVITKGQIISEPKYKKNKVIEAELEKFMK